MKKQTLFISYCWKDGNTYADELEMQLKDEFDVKRDKSQLIANDDMYEFMAGIANCDNVVIVLTSEYVKSLNCMLEMAFLVSQEDWALKAMVLVIDDSLYFLERKIEVINYWLLRQKRILNESNEIGQSLYAEEQEYLNLICENIEQFFKGVSRRKNPSQIAIVNEVIKKSKNNQKAKEDLITVGEMMILNILEGNEQMTMSEILSKTNMGRTSVQRHMSSLIKRGIVQQVGNGRTRSFSYKK